MIGLWTQRFANSNPRLFSWKMSWLLREGNCLDGGVIKGLSSKHWRQEDLLKQQYRASWLQRNSKLRQCRKCLLSSTGSSLGWKEWMPWPPLPYWHPWFSVHWWWRSTRPNSRNLVAHCLLPQGCTIFCPTGLICEVLLDPGHSSQH